MPHCQCCYKGNVSRRDEPVIIILNHATLIDDDNESEPLPVPFELMRHGIKVDLTPQNLDGVGAMYIEEEYMPLEWDNEKLFVKIEKPNECELGELEMYELNSPISDMAFNIGTARRKKKFKAPSDILMDKWRKRFAILPDQVVDKTLENSACYYLNVESEKRQDCRRHYKYRFPGLRLPRQRETVASDTFFPSVTSRRGNTCSQFFVGLDSDQWEVYPMRSESHNVSAFQDYCRNVGIPPTLKTDNAQ
eukprot:891034-Ditylum_brightwellii.AAC.1